jgi:hypothetical protein
LQSMGHTVDVIDYWRPVNQWQYLLGRMLARDDRNLARNLITVVYKALEMGISHRVFAGFCRKHLSLTRRYNSFDDLVNDPPFADVYVTGSDQVWNSIYNNGIDQAMFLGFAPKGAKRISYAASFGVDVIAPDEHDMTRSLIHNYDAIAVREDGAVSTIKNLGRHDAVQVLDPTLLLSKQEWAALAADRKYRQPYVLLYSVECKQARLSFQYAKEIAERKRCKLIHLTSGGPQQQIKGCDRSYFFQTPHDFLSMFLHSEYVVANSFHGTAFALSFEKPFISVVPDNFSGRAASLLRAVGLERRLVDHGLCLERVLTDVDYTAVNERIAHERHKSMEFLRHALA